MTTTQNSQSSFGTIIFTTNIPGDKEYTLDPTNISYSDEPDSKITHTTNKIYFFNDKVINNNFFSNLKKTNILSIIFNKKRFDKLAFAKDDKENSPQLDEREIITSNIMSYIENIFTTFPKSYNIKNINNMNNMGSLKFSLPYSSIPYTYLKVNGTEHTVSRVVYYDDKQNDDISIEIINDYNEFEKWYPNEKKFLKVFATPLLNDFKKLFDKKMTKNNLFNTFGKNETNNKQDFDENIEKYRDYIRRINDYNRESKVTPSHSWPVEKINETFFEKDWEKIQNDTNSDSYKNSLNNSFDLNNSFNLNNSFTGKKKNDRLLWESSVMMTKINKSMNIDPFHSEEPMIDGDEEHFFELSQDRDLSQGHFAEFNGGLSGQNVGGTKITPRDVQRDVQDKIRDIIKKFKEKVQSEVGLTENGFIPRNRDNKFDIFKALVSELQNEIKEIDEGLDFLWVDFETPENKQIQVPEDLTKTNLDVELKKYEGFVESSIKQKETYDDYYKNNAEGSPLIAEILSNIADHDFTGTIVNARTDKEINNFQEAAKTIFSSYQLLFNINNELEDKVTTDSLNKAYKASRIISDQLKQIKKPVGLSSSLFPSHKFKDIIELLDSFLTHYDIYDIFFNKMYDTELLNSKYSKYKEYKQYIDFIKKIKKIYEYNDEFELKELQNMIRDGDLVKVRKDSGFENESIRLHIDLIKGKVDDTNIKQIECKYKDNDLVERWNKLDEIKDDSIKLVPMYYFKIDDKKEDPKKVKTGGKKTRRRRRKKYVYTRKR